MQSFKDKVIAQAQSLQRTLVLPEGDDPRIVVAASRIIEQNIASEVYLLGTREAIARSAQYSSTSLHKPGIHIVDPVRSEYRDSFSELYYSLRKHRGVTLEMAKEAVQDPLNFAALMVKQGKAYAMVAGAKSITADVLRSAITIIKPQKNTKLVSSCFVMQFRQLYSSFASVATRTIPGDMGGIIFSDCANIPQPSSDDLVEIATGAAESCKKYLNTAPRIAFLSFSTHGSACHPEVDRVRTAARLFKEKFPDIVSDGELQYDAAVIPDVASFKAPASPLYGKSNVLIFPDLNTGNIAYKLAQRTSHAEAYGPFLQGLSGPVSDLSRGCSAEDVLVTAAATLTQENNCVIPPT